MRERRERGEQKCPQEEQKMNNKFRNKLTKSTVKNMHNTDFSSLQKSSSYIDELEPWIGQNVLIESDDWALMPGRIGSNVCDTIVFHSIKIIRCNSADEKQIPVKIFGRFWTAIDKDLKRRINLTEINGVLPIQLDGVFYEHQVSETKQSEDAGKKGLGFRCFSMWKKGQRKNEYNDISDLSPGKDYIKELECFDNKTIYMQFSEWDVNRSRSDYDVVKIKSAYASDDCNMATYEHYDFKKDALIKVGKSVKMRGLFKPGKERTLQIKCNIRTCAAVERDKKGKKRAVKMTSIICSKVEGAGSRKICEES